MGLRITPGDTFVATKDYDGYPAVRVHNKVWVEEDDWITASDYCGDQEQRVRDLAAALVKMADQMAAERRRASA